MTLQRQIGGRGLIDLNSLWQGQIRNLRTFFFDKSNNSKIHLAITETDNKFTPLNLKDNSIEFDSKTDTVNKKIQT